MPRSNSGADLGPLGQREVDWERDFRFFDKLPKVLQDELSWHVILPLSAEEIYDALQQGRPVEQILSILRQLPKLLATEGEDDGPTLGK